MIQCPFCQSVYPDNTLFCEECGSYLYPNNEQATAPLGEQEAEHAEQGETTGTAGATLILTIQDGGRIELPLSKQVTLGRLDAGRAIFPDVDLTREDGMDMGVSRRHARILRQEDQIFLEDLGSLNGTLLNAHRIATETPYPLKDGDQIQLGKLILTINFK